MNEFSVIAFDLDDTLLDTSKYLIKKAAEESCTAMIRAGLQTNITNCMLMRENFLQEEPRGDVFEHLADEFAPMSATAADIAAIARIGYKTFYIREVDSNIALLEGAHELLTRLKKDYRLFLITAGNPKTQQKKIDLLKISDFFESVFIVDPLKNETKLTAFKKITDATKLSPAAHLSVGNRLDTDLAPAKSVGWATCWIRYGEYAHMKPQGENETPTYQIDQITELPATCQL